MKFGLRQSLTHFAQGLLMGGADIIPGVSGGTMALIVGIYSRLIAGLSDVFSTVIALAKFDFAGAAERARVVEWGLLVPLGAGIISALVIGARIIPHLIETYPHQSLGLFFGLVAGSIAIPWKRIDRKTSVIFLVAAGFAVAAFLLTGIPPQQAGNPTLIRVFATAAVAICAMILPGVSGAFLLKVLGMYEVTLAAVNARDVLYVATFVLGAAVGIGLFSKLLDWLLSNRYNVTMAALVGLMVGAIRALWPWQDADRSLLLPDPGEPIWSVVLLGVLGFALVTALAVWSARIEKRAEQAT
jgi:putative membrane protein